MKYLKVIILSLLLIPTFSTPSYSSSSHISYAQKFIGLHEIKDNKKLTQLLGVNPRRTKWCRAFVNAVIAKTKKVKLKDLRARTFKEGKAVKTPRKGDIIVFRHHIGFFVKSIKVKGVEYYEVLGGNQSNSVKISKYRKSTVIGIRRL